ncbi:MAG TPA: TetR/AcrR family transcriptional regulator [Methylovirgula sp.]|nr:TetR/AcrR family transcriptional regulator [Methylovirgula sp.]
MPDTRDKLIAEAEVLVRTRGYAGFSYADLAEAVGIRKASIHHHFPTKEDLGLALIAAYGKKYDRALDEIWRKTEDGLKRVEAYAELYLHGLREEQGCLAAAMATEIGILPERIRDGVAQFFERHVAWLARVLSEGRANGTIRDDVSPAQHARMIVATLEGALLMELLLGGPAGFKDTLSALRKSLKPSRPPGPVNRRQPAGARRARL